MGRGGRLSPLPPPSQALPLFLTWGLSDLSTRIILNKCHIFSLFLLGKRAGLVVLHLPYLVPAQPLAFKHSISLYSCAGLGELGAPSCSVGSRYCRTCPGWGTEWLLGQAVLYGSQHSIIPFGGWHVCDCDGCPAMPGRDWLGWDWWCQCPGEAGASLTGPMPVSCSAEPICAHLGHSSPLTASTSCSPSPVPEPATQGLTAHLEPSILTVWPLCLCISRLLGGANMSQVGRAPVRSSGSGISGAVTHELPGHGLRRCLCQKTGDFNAIRCHLILHNSCCLIH